MFKLELKLESGDLHYGEGVSLGRLRPHSDRLVFNCFFLAGGVM